MNVTQKLETKTDDKVREIEVEVCGQSCCNGLSVNTRALAYIT